MAQDISITMGLDNTQMLTALNQTTSKVNDFANNAKTQLQGVSESITKLNETTVGISESFEKLGTAVLGIGLAEFVAHAFEASSEMVNMASSLNVSTQSFMEMNAAMVAAGKGSDALGQAISKMEMAAEKAAEGNGKLQDAFGKVGVSMDYLKTHSAEDTFNKIAQALANMQDPAQKALTMQELLGKGFKGADLEEYIKNLDKLKGTMSEEAEAAENAAHFYDQLKQGFTLLQGKVVELIENFTGLKGDQISGILGSKVAAESLLTVLGLITASKVLGAISDLVTMIKGLGLAFIPTSAAAVAGTASVDSYAASLVHAQASSIAFTAGLGRVQTAQNTVNVATIELNAALAKYGIGSAEAIAATNALAAAETRLATMNEAAALSQTQLAERFGLTTVAAEGATAAVTTSTGVFGTLGAMLTGLASAIGGFLAAIGLPEILIGLAAIATAVGGIIIVWKAFGDVISDWAGKAISWIKDVGGAIYEWITSKIDAAANALRSFTDKIGLTSPRAQSQGETLPDTGAGAGRGKVNPTSPSVLNPAQSIVDPAAGVKATLASIQQQYQLMTMVNQRAQERLDLEISLAGASDETKRSQLAAFDATTKYETEIAKIDGEIKKYEAEKAGAGDSAKRGAYQQIINTLIQEKTLLTNNNQLMADKTAELTKQNNLAAMAQVYLDARLKVEKNLSDITTQMDELTMTNDEKKIANINKEIAAEQELAIKKRQAQLGSTPISEDETNQIKQKIADIYEVQKVATQNEIDLSRDWATGWTAAFKQYVDEGTNAAKMSGDVFNSLTKNMNSAIDNFVKTGKFNFGDFARSVIQDMISIELKAEATQVFKSLFGGGSGTGGLFSSISSLFGFADGGDPPVGKASIVGENGPELFVPKVPGTIVPNGAMGGGQQITNNNVTHNYNINAIDSQSVAQFFAANRKTALASVQMAQQELPYNNSRF